VPRRQPRSLGTHIAIIAASVLAIGLVAWVVAGVVFALLHVIELVVVAGLAGWAGYRVGRYRGSRQRR
jgi:hypothetical protein